MYTEKIQVTRRKFYRIKFQGKAREHICEKKCDTFVSLLTLH